MQKTLATLMDGIRFFTEEHGMLGSNLSNDKEVLAEVYGHRFAVTGLEVDQGRVVVKLAHDSRRPPYAIGNLTEAIIEFTKLGDMPEEQALQLPVYASRGRRIFAVTQVAAMFWEGRLVVVLGTNT